MISISTLKAFIFERTLHEDPFTHTICILGNVPTDATNPNGERSKAIIRLERSALDGNDSGRFFGENGLVKRVQVDGSTDIYSWLFGWFGEDREKDVKINLICPATDVHISKYTTQNQILVHETPELYDSIVKPYIIDFPPSRTRWVEDILTGKSEQSKILYSSADYMILPDMKWDSSTISSLYLIAIAQDRSIRSLRDLRKKHIPMLKSIITESYKVCAEKWGLGNGSLRIYVHYHPSYYHFHVHIVNANFHGLLGMAVGQAHLLDDIISLLELDSAEGPSIFERMTLTYGLGEQHGLFNAMRNAST